MRRSSGEGSATAWVGRIDASMQVWGNELMREVLLHGGADEAFDRSVAFARRLAETFGARLHVLYTVEDPLSAGWTAEVSPDRMPEVHQAMETEARERLARYISPEDQDRLDVQIAIRMGPADDELVRYTESHKIDLAILQASPANETSAELARALLDRGRCALLILR
jgi:nucleotide-binding universal stress UspA family protein